LDTCFTTHHLNFDRDGKIWFSSGSPTDPVVGWFDTKKWDETHDERRARAGRRSSSTPMATAR